MGNVINESFLSSRDRINNVLKKVNVNTEAPIAKQKPITDDKSKGLADYLDALGKTQQSFLPIAQINLENRPVGTDVFQEMEINEEELGEVVDFTEVAATPEQQAVYDGEIQKAAQIENRTTWTVADEEKALEQFLKDNDISEDMIRIFIQNSKKLALRDYSQELTNEPGNSRKILMKMIAENRDGGESSAYELVANTLSWLSNDQTLYISGEEHENFEEAFSSVSPWTGINQNELKQLGYADLQALEKDYNDFHRTFTPDKKNYSDVLNFYFYINGMASIKQYCQNTNTDLTQTLKDIGNMGKAGSYEVIAKFGMVGVDPDAKLIAPMLLLGREKAELSAIDLSAIKDDTVILELAKLREQALQSGTAEDLLAYFSKLKELREKYPKVESSENLIKVTQEFSQKHAEELRRAARMQPGLIQWVLTTFKEVKLEPDFVEIAQESIAEAEQEQALAQSILSGDQKQFTEYLNSERYQDHQWLETVVKIIEKDQKTRSERSVLKELQVYFKWLDRQIEKKHSAQKAYDQQLAKNLRSEAESLFDRSMVEIVEMSPVLRAQLLINKGKIIALTISMQTLKEKNAMSSEI